MAARYLLIVGAGDLEVAPIAARLPDPTGWTELRFGGHLLLANAEAELRPLRGDRGAVLGALFRKGPPSRAVRSLDDEDTAWLTGAAGPMGALFWGGYLDAFESAGGLTVRRDPSGAMPCLVCERAGRTVLASDVGVLDAVGGWNAEVDVDAVARVLWTGGLPAPRTSLAGVEELPPGAELVVGGHARSVRQWWSPWDHVAVDADPAGAADRVREVVQDAVRSLCAGRTALLLGASGGLDSSIVAACVPEAGCRLTCFTASTRDPLGDERAGARVLADHVGARLVEAWYDESPEDLWHTGGEHLPSPAFRATVSAYARIQREVAGRVRPDAILSGHGGDNVFGFTRSAAPVVDRLRARGARMGILSTVGDVSALTGAGAFEVAKAAWRRWRSSDAAAWRPDPRFLSASFLSAQGSEPPRHGWLAAPADARPGKVAHVAAILRAQVHSQGVLDRSHVPTICPLLSQPVVEACLAIPSWRWVEGGRDRSVARDAFRGVLPVDIAERRSKGSPDGHARALFDRNRASIRERLLDGRLSGSGVLDRPALEIAMARSAAESLRDLARLLTLLDAEAWMDHWAGRVGGADQSGARRASPEGIRSRSARHLARSGWEAPPCSQKENHSTFRR